MSPASPPQDDAGNPSGAEAATVALPAQVDGTPAPERLPHVPGYVIERELGRGGMGVVYQAMDVRLKRRVALKMLLAGVNASEAELDRFRTEAETVARLQHPSIVQIYEVGFHDGLPYLALEFCPGGPLDRKLAGNPLPPKEAAALVEGLARAMHAAHQKSIIHRDLKPANVLLTTDGQPKISDFGLARLLDQERGQTQSGAILGTPSYMAPEQANGQGKTVTPATDVYALGAILYELLTGHPPFRAARPLDTILQVISTEPIPPRQVQSLVPPDLDTICLKCLQKPAARRYLAAEALADDLARFLKGEPIQARPVSRRERAWLWCKRNPGLSALAAAVVLVLVAGTSISSFLAWQATRERNRADDNLYVAETNLAAIAWDRGDVERTTALLSHYEHPGTRDARGWEWYYLWRLSHQELAQLDDADDRNRRFLVFSPDGAQLVSTHGADGWVWDVATGHKVRTITGPPGGLAFSSDGKRMAWLVQTNNGRGSSVVEMRVCDAHTGKELARWPLDEWASAPVVFSPDKRFLATVTGPENANRIPFVSHKNLVKVWDSVTGKAALTLGGGFDTTFADIAYSPDGRYLLAVGDDQIYRWDLRTGKLADLSLKSDGRAMRLSPTGDLVAMLTRVAVQIWDLRSLQLQSTLPVQEEGRILGFSPDGSKLAIAESTGVRIWDTLSGQPLRSLKGAREIVMSPDGWRAAGWNSDGVLKLWDLLHDHEDRVLACAKAWGFVAGCTTLVGSRGADLQLWDLASGQKTRSLEPRHSTELENAAVNLAGTRLVSVGDTFTNLFRAEQDLGDVKIWDLTTGQLLANRRRIDPFEFQRVALNGDGSRLVALDPKGVGEWEPTDLTDSVRRFLPEGHTQLNSNWYTNATFSPDGSWLAFHDFGTSAVHVWNVSRGKETAVLPPAGAVYFSPNGHVMASMGLEGLTLRDLPDGQQRWTMRGPRTQLAAGGQPFSPDGRRLATTGDGLTLWDTAGGKEVFSTSAAVQKGLRFSPDGWWLAYESVAGVHLLDARPLTPEVRVEREARGLVDYLFARPLLKTEVIRELQACRTIREEVRQKALDLVVHYQDEASRFDHPVRVIVFRRGQAAQLYRRALTWAEVAAKLQPKDPTWGMLLGMAQYRVGQYQRAAQTLATAEGEMRPTITQLSRAMPLAGSMLPISGRSDATLDAMDKMLKTYLIGVAFQAMAEAELGRKEQARATLARLNAMDLPTARPTLRSDNEVRAILFEAEQRMPGKHAGTAK